MGLAMGHLWNSVTFGVTITSVILKELGKNPLKLKLIWGTTTTTTRPQESTPRVQTHQNIIKSLGVHWTPLRLQCVFYTILPELLKYTQKQPKCTPKRLLMLPIPLTGPDTLTTTTTTTTTRRTQEFTPRVQTLQNITKSLGSCGPPYVYSVFFTRYCQNC